MQYIYINTITHLKGEGIVFQEACNDPEELNILHLELLEQLHGGHCEVLCEEQCLD